MRSNWIGDALPALFEIGKERELVGARGMAPRPATFRSRCGSRSRRSPSTGCAAHDSSAPPPPPGATDRDGVVVAAVLDADSEKAAAHRLGLSHSTVKHHQANARSKVGAETMAQLVWILAPRLPAPDGGARDGRVACQHNGTACPARETTEATGVADLGLHVRHAPGDGDDWVAWAHRMFDDLPSAITTIWLSDHLQIDGKPWWGHVDAADLAGGHLPECPRRDAGHLAELPQSGPSRGHGSHPPGALRRTTHPGSRGGLARGGVPRVPLRLPEPGHTGGPAGRDDRGAQGAVDDLPGHVPRRPLRHLRRGRRASTVANPGHGGEPRAQGRSGGSPPRRLVAVGRPARDDLSRAVRAAPGRVRGDRPSLRVHHEIRQSRH